MKLTQAMRPIANWLSSPAVIERLSKPGFMKWSIAGFITVNMITWPAFIMCDRKTPAKARAYSAERQFFQELLSLVCQLSIASLFELAGAKSGAWLFPDHFQNKSSPANPQGLFNLGDWRRNSKVGWHEAVRHNSVLMRKICEAKTPELAKALRRQMIPINEVVRGSIRVGSTVGSLLALVVVAPWVNNLLLPSFVKGMDKTLNILSGGKIKLSPEGLESEKPLRQALSFAFYNNSGLVRPVQGQPVVPLRSALRRQSPSGDRFCFNSNPSTTPDDFVMPERQMPAPGNLNAQTSSSPPQRMALQAPSIYNRYANPILLGPNSLF